MDIQLYGNEKIRVISDYKGDNFVDIRKTFDENSITIFRAIDCNIEIWELDGEIHVVSEKNKEPESSSEAWYRAGKMIMRIEKRRKIGG
jgi:hypothetical protein